MPENAGNWCKFDANILMLFQLDSMKYVILQDHHLRNHPIRLEFNEDFRNIVKMEMLLSVMSLFSSKNLEKSVKKIWRLNEV